MPGAPVASLAPAYLATAAAVISDQDTLSHVHTTRASLLPMSRSVWNNLLF